MPLTAEEAGVPNEAAAYLASLEDPEVVERVRCSIPDAHVFKLPPRQTAGGWRGADWDQEVWQGTLKVVERGDLTVVLLVDRTSGAIFAVCPVKDGAVDRCVDSSRYFVLRVENANGRHIYIGMAFNERNDAFDFNTSLEDSRREREAAANPVQVDVGPSKDYSIKEGQKIHINVKVGGTEKKSKSKDGKKKKAAGGFLKPNTRDTPRRLSDT
uniref:NECAP PHear domain-containing protein n=1 Tax=Entomoneis paludosa TaxID=265537 RepID=A0A7S2YCS3_9STRA|mmetsp:Transcript_27668/g.57920  ORF Transcript_27668/g.57920 Transcript_27668/m.57920 type:complete len:213 (+) Transcript_27668:207-845(+)|eukprot:CAMPEP_0172447852 /NCGR_PEP_ID=MMETSP1065-20121228/7032_1 /TAXON_ID=265537 /ORGANISM="Amphiprora paludosa, Strain CCMP125" /LENGTH=212 /DNA_ID=CAMNT_0013199223 /DNA_START=121 /DNA_END=759 /DNA_ORIENTATION=+